MAFQLLFLFSFVFGSVFHVDKVSSLNKFREFLHKGINLLNLLIAVPRKYLKRRITYSNGQTGSFNPAVITNVEAQMIYRNMNNETGSSQPAGFHKKTSRKFLPHQPVVLVKCKGKTEALF